jgi:predicted ester cyclase
MTLHKDCFGKQQPDIAPCDIQNEAPMNQVAVKKGSDEKRLVPLAKKGSKWTDETIIHEINKIKMDIGHFPTNTELMDLERSNLASAIAKHGGINKYREMLGEKLIQVSPGYWTEEIILEELKKIKDEIGHFPKQKELNGSLERSDLANAMAKHGGFNKYREILGEEIIQVSRGYWTEEIILEELKKIRDEIGHFPIQKELNGFLERSDLVGAISLNGGINRYRGLLGAEIIRVSHGYWTEETILEELKKIRDEIGHFPIYAELRDLERSDLAGAISTNGGINKYREMLGEEIRKLPNGYWTEEIILEELKKIGDDIGHFPTNTELMNMERFDLASAIAQQGGYNRFREMLGEEIIHVSRGYWTEETILEEMKKIRDEIGHFPASTELMDLERSDLSNAISNHGGFNIYREMLGEEIRKLPNGYWTEETILEELKKIRDDIGHFPKQIELNGFLERSDLVGAISTNGGINKYREMLGEEIRKLPNGYWTEETILEELKTIRCDIGHFPTFTELNDLLELSDLANAVTRGGGINKYREMLGEEIIQVSPGYWTEETILEKLKKKIAEIGHFPTHTERNGFDLSNAIARRGGINKYREMLGYPVSLYQKYRVELASYIKKRGTSSEKIVKLILKDWCKQNGYAEPEYNKKLAMKNVIEFVCNTGRSIGIDVTNTKNISGDNIRNKYRHKDYSKHLDELWIVVFSDVFTSQDYDLWNEESPENVKVMSIDEFLEELDYSADDATKCKIDKFCECTFHTKEELKTHRQQHHQSSIEDFI